MMIRVYAMYDQAAKGFGSLMVFVNDEVARRGVMEIIRGDQQITKFPGDFDLYRLGEFDTDTGAIAPSRPELVFKVAELLSASQSASNGG